MRPRRLGGGGILAHAEHELSLDRSKAAGEDGELDHQAGLGEADDLLEDARLVVDAVPYAQCAAGPRQVECRAMTDNACARPGAKS